MTDTPSAPLPPDTEHLYHLALRAEWEEALAGGVDYRRSTVGRSLEEEGFIHTSFAHQVQGTAAAFYRNHDVVLLVIDPAVVPSEVRVDDVGGGRAFPHVYGPIPLDAVVRVDEVALDDDGVPVVGHLVDTGGAPGADPAGLRPQTLRVVQLNAGTLLEGNWSERRHEVVAWLRHLQPDVVCLQEVWQSDTSPNTAGWIVDAMPEAAWHMGFGGDCFDPSLWDAPDLRFGSAVLSRWPVESSTYHRLPTVDDDELFPAQIPWELLHVRTAGLDVFSCHLASAPHHGLHRRVQVLAIDEIIRAARGDAERVRSIDGPRADMPPILCGDFNAEPDSDEIRFLCSLSVLDGRTTFYQDAWRVAGAGPGWTQDWRGNPIAGELNVPRKRIDYVFVGDPFKRAGHAGRVLSARLAFHRPMTGVVASDHYGLSVDVLWPTRPR